MPKREYAEDCNYWKSGQSSPDSWLEKTIGLIEKNGGDLLASGFGDEHATGRAAFMIRFTLDGETFKIVWPVMPSKHGEALAARRQAATMLFHDVKAKCIAAQVLGSRVSFFAWKELPDGAPAFQHSDAELLQEIPRLYLPAPPSTK